MYHTDDYILFCALYQKLVPAVLQYLGGFTITALVNARNSFMEDATAMRITLKQRLSVKQIAVHHILLQKVSTINKYTPEFFPVNRCCQEFNRKKFQNVCKIQKCFKKMKSV